MLDKDKLEKQFLEAYNSYSDAIFRHCYYRVFDREMAQDFVQETYCRTWKYIAEGNEVKNIRALLYRVANNIIIDESRKKKSFSLDAIMEKGFLPKIDQTEKQNNKILGREMVELINKLDSKYRDVIIMRYIDELSIREIVSIIGETKDNVYVRIHRGLKMVKDILKEQDNKRI